MNGCDVNAGDRDNPPDERLTRFAPEDRCVSRSFSRDERDDRDRSSCTGCTGFVFVIEFIHAPFVSAANIVFSPFCTPSSWALVFK